MLSTIGAGMVKAVKEERTVRIVGKVACVHRVVSRVVEMGFLAISVPRGKRLD